MSLYDYSIAVLANNNVKHFLDYLIESLVKFNFDFSNFYLGDVGLTGYVNKVGLNIISLPYKDYGEFKTQSNNYRKIIKNRFIFLDKVFNLSYNKKVLQLDSDTYVLDDSFTFIDESSDVTLTVREVGQGCYVEKFFYKMNRYPNCGVIFWNNADNCKIILDRWAKLYDEVEPHRGQYEQNVFLHLMETDEFKKLNVQEVHCKYCNCYKEEWFKYNPSIIHFKGGDARTSDFRNPKPGFLKYCRTERGL